MQSKRNSNASSNTLKNDYVDFDSKTYLANSYLKQIFESKTKLKIQEWV